MHSIRLIAVDIDGTLLNSSFQVSAANLKALLGAHQRGVEIALVTGRRHNFALPIADSLGFSVTLISSNGAVTRSSDGSLFHRDLLPADIAREMVRHMAAFRGNTVLSFDREGKGALVVETTELLNVAIRRWMEKNAEYLDLVKPLEDAVTESPVQATFCGDIARMQEAQQALMNSGLWERITVLRTQYEERDLCIVDVLNHGCSKGHALRRWAEHRGIERQQVMAIGDNYNDIEMLEFAGVPVIMANACDELKQNGWMITLGNNQDGVAHAVESVLG
ncbi:MAG: Cof-type HAD-IIB family hydrolase [Candidatus Korobacteraceae bacterium]|jgi:Cof subfamily protein (haloacid dehalogenase superfamily)